MGAKSSPPGPIVGGRTSKCASARRLGGCKATTGFPKVGGDRLLCLLNMVGSPTQGMPLVSYHSHRMQGNRLNS